MEFKEFVADLKRRIDETEEPAKKRELEARLARAEADHSGETKGVKARHVDKRHLAVSNKPVENNGESDMMNNDPESAPNAKNDAAAWQEDAPPARLNDGLAATDQVYQGQSVTGDIDVDKERDDLVLAKDADVDRDDKGNAINEGARKESEEAEERNDSDKPAEKPSDRKEGGDPEDNKEAKRKPARPKKDTPAKPNDKGKASNDTVKSAGESADVHVAGDLKVSDPKKDEKSNDVSGSGGITLPKTDSNG